MAQPNYSIVLHAPLVSGASIAVGDCLVPNGSGQWVIATTANRTSYGRARGIALTAYSGSGSTGSVQMQTAGNIDTSVSGLSAGTVSWVRVSSAGRLERVTPGSGDDLFGKTFATGDVQLCPGVFDSDNYAGGTGALVDLTSEVTGTLPVANGGTGITSLGSGVATFLGTPSGANLASALTSALPNTDGGTGQDSSGWTGLALVTSGAWSAQSVGANVPAFLATPSSANLASAVTDETGSGALVFGTGPTISGPTLSGSPVISATDMSATGNARCKVYSNIASVQTTDATETSIYTWTITDEAVTMVTVEVLACLSTGADTAVYVRRIKFKRDGGTVTAGTVETTFTDESVAGWNATIDNSGSTGRVRVTGALSSTIDWGVVVTRLEVTHA